MDIKTLVIVFLMTEAENDLIAIQINGNLFHVHVLVGFKQ